MQLCEPYPRMPTLAERNPQLTPASASARTPARTPASTDLRYVRETLNHEISSGHSLPSANLLESTVKLATNPSQCLALMMPVLCKEVVAEHSHPDSARAATYPASGECMMTFDMLDQRTRKMKMPT